MDAKWCNYHQMITSFKSHYPAYMLQNKSFIFFKVSLLNFALRYIFNGPFWNELMTVTASHEESD